VLVEGEGFGLLTDEAEIPSASPAPEVNPVAKLPEDLSVRAIAHWAISRISVLFVLECFDVHVRN
jgi:hypothetical protein